MRTTEGTRPKTKRGTRGRADRPSQRRRFDLPPSAPGREEGRRARHTHDPAAPRFVDPAREETYARLFRSALLQPLAAIGARLDSGVLMLARSRATMRTWDLAGLSSHEAGEEIRSRVTAEEADRLGIVRSGSLWLTPWGDLFDVEASPERHEDDLQVPRGRALDGERVRRGGRRR